MCPGIGAPAYGLLSGGESGGHPNASGTLTRSRHRAQGQCPGPSSASPPSGALDRPAWHGPNAVWQASIASQHCEHALLSAAQIPLHAESKPRHQQPCSFSVDMTAASSHHSSLHCMTYKTTQRSNCMSSNFANPYLANSGHVAVHQLDEPHDGLDHQDEQLQVCPEWRADHQCSCLYAHQTLAQ